MKRLRRGSLRCWVSNRETEPSRTSRITSSMSNCTWMWAGATSTLFSPRPPLSEAICWKCCFSRMGAAAPARTESPASSHTSVTRDRIGGCEAGEPVGARLFADLMSTRLNRLVVMDLHNPAVEGFFAIPVEHLSGIPLLAEEIRSALPENPLLVAPDLGAVKLAHRYADVLDLPVAYIHKERSNGVKVTTRRVIGEVKGKAPVVVDDMISTGGTIRSALKTLLDLGCVPDLTVVATHGLFVADALERFSPMPIQKILVTDSVPQANGPERPLHVASIADLLAETIKRLNEA